MAGMNNDVRMKRNELYQNSLSLRNLSNWTKLKKEKTKEIRDKQQEIYKKWEFYDKLLKATGGEKNGRK